jgi:hypothetical protein
MRMRFKKINERYSVTRNVGQKGGFRFTYAFIDGWYVTVNHIVKYIKYNSLWMNIYFKDESEVINWCENFYYKNFKCLGTDA